MKVSTLLVVLSLGPPVFKGILVSAVMSIFIGEVSPKECSESLGVTLGNTWPIEPNSS